MREPFDGLLAEWGRLDILANGAGIAPLFAMVDMPADKWRLALDANLAGYFLMAREAARTMIAQGMDAGIQVTAYHNPAKYNGFKIPARRRSRTEKGGVHRRQEPLLVGIGAFQPLNTRQAPFDTLEQLLQNVRERGYSFDNRSDKQCGSEEDLAMAEKMNHKGATVGTESKQTTRGRRAAAQPEGPYAQSWPALVDKYLSAPIRSVGWCTMMALFLVLLPPVLDNLKGEIENRSSLLWSTVKGLVLALLFFFVLITRRVCGWIWRQKG